MMQNRVFPHSHPRGLIMFEEPVLNGVKHYTTKKQRDNQDICFFLSTC